MSELDDLQPRLGVTGRHVPFLRDTRLQSIAYYLERSRHVQESLEPVDQQPFFGLHSLNGTTRGDLRVRNTENCSESERRDTVAMKRTTPQRNLMMGEEQGYGNLLSLQWEYDLDRMFRLVDIAAAQIVPIHGRAVPITVVLCQVNRNTASGSGQQR